MLELNIIQFIFYFCPLKTCVMLSLWLSARWQNGNGLGDGGKVFKRITGRLCQTIQDKEITFTNPTLWYPPHKMSLSSAIIEHRADTIVKESFPTPSASWLSKYLVSLSRVWFEKCSVSALMVSFTCQDTLIVLCLTKRKKKRKLFHWIYTREFLEFRHSPH